MTITVTMLQNRLGENGAIWTTGNSYSASDAFGSALINSNFATGTLPTPPQSAFTAAQVAELASGVSGAGVSDPSSLTLTTAMANTTRLPAGTQTYTIDAATAWTVGDGVAVFLPTSGTVSFAVSGGPTLNGASSTLTRTLAGNALGYVVLSRIAGTNSYSLSGV